jgi:16S rRNA processing protein RimM
MTSTPSSRLIRVGRVAGAFGVKGEVRITSFTETPLALVKYGALLKDDGSPGLTLLSGREQKGAVIAKVKEVSTPEQADALRGLFLCVARDALPEPDEDEFYLTDLVGLAALTPEGESLGQIKSVRDFGAGDLLEIQPPAGQSWFVAFTRDNVPEVSVPEGRVVIVRPAEVSEKDV